ncbi:hypothetical protein MNBD_ALPHA03-422 [hydrothermal vent metagenome]|uniref:Flagellar protein FliL n=1 Tax=hydrothermal vent metagenome TaxID=652676 RepID=A0A3B1BAQ3_9ZZZZ
MGLIFMTSQFFIIAQSGAEEKKADNPETTPQLYINVPPFAVTMYHKGRPKGNMTITMLIQIAEGEKHTAATRILPRLSNAYLMEANRLAHDYFDVTRPVNIGILGETFQIATNRTLGHKEARVLISDVVVNKR